MRPCMWHKAGLSDTGEAEKELKSVHSVSLNAQYILCFLDHLSPITEQWHSFNFQSAFQKASPQAHIPTLTCVCTRINRHICANIRAKMQDKLVHTPAFILSYVTSKDKQSLHLPLPLLFESLISLLCTVSTFLPLCVFLRNR